jgi:hypothetical protein
MGSASKTDALNAYDSEIAAVKQQRDGYRIAGRLEAFTENEIVKGALPYFLVAFSAMIFSLFLGRRFPGGRAKAARVYLYCMTAATFWPLLGFELTGTVANDILLYLPPHFNDEVKYLWSVLNGAGDSLPPDPSYVRIAPLLLAQQASAVWAVWMVGWISRRLGHAYPKVGAIKVFLGAIGASALTGVIAYILIFVFAQLVGIGSDFVNSHKFGDS